MLKNLENKIKSIPRDALKQWKNFVEDIKKGAILDSLKAQQLKFAMNRIPLRTLKDAENRIFGQGDKVTGMLKNLEKSVKRIPKDALSQWRKYVDSVKKGAILDSLRAQQLNSTLGKIPLRTIKDAQERIIGQGDKVKGMLKNLDKQLKRVPRDALKQWKQFNDDAKKGAILDGFRAKELKFTMSKIPVRTLKDALERVIGQGDKVKGMLKNLDNKLKKIPRDALKNWRDYNDNVKRGAILDGLKARELKNLLEKIPLRTVKDAEERIIGQGDKVKGMLKNLDKQLLRIPRDALNLWKKFNDDAKKGAILDGFRAKELKFTMSKIPVRTLKDALERVIGQGDKVKGMLKNLDNKLKRVPRDALKNWRDYNDNVKRGAILDGLKARELKNLL